MFWLLIFNGTMGMKERFVIKSRSLDEANKVAKAVLEASDDLSEIVSVQMLDLEE